MGRSDLKSKLLEKIAEYLVFGGSGVTQAKNYGPGVVSVPTSTGGLVKDLATAGTHNVSGMGLGQAEDVIRKTLINPKTLRENPVVAGHSRGAYALESFLQKKPQLAAYLRKKYNTQFVGMGRPYAMSSPPKALDMDIVGRYDPVPRLRGVPTAGAAAKVLNVGKVAANPHSSEGYVEWLKKLVKARKKVT